MNTILPNSTEESTQKAQLQVELPHWSALVRVFNSEGAVVCQPADMSIDSKSSNESDKIWLASTQVPYGAYAIELYFDRQIERKSIVIYDEKGFYISNDTWKKAVIRSTAPLKGSFIALDHHIRAAEEWSRKRTSQRLSGDSELFLFLSTLAPEKHTSFFANLALLDSNEKFVTSFVEEAVINKKEGWMAFNISLPTGFYILKRHGYGAHRTCYQPIYLCSGWQTQIFIEAKPRPTLRTLEFYMVNPEKGFQSNDEVTSAVSVMMNTMRRTTCLDDLAIIRTLKKILADKIDNPWLAITICHMILLLQDEIFLEEDLRSYDWTKSLLSGLLDYLEVVPEQPDVQALLLDTTQSSEKPLQYPPLLYAGLLRVQENATIFPQTIQTNSILAKILPLITNLSAWTSWTQLKQQGNTQKSRPNATPIVHEINYSQDNDNELPSTWNNPFIVKPPDYLQSLSPKLPIFQVKQSPIPSQNLAIETPKYQNSVTGLSEAYFNAKVVQATQNIEFDSEYTVPDRVQYNSMSNWEDLFADVRAKEISSIFKAPIAEVFKSIEKLIPRAKSVVKFNRKITNLDKSIFKYVLNKSFQRNVDDTLQITLEECAGKLQAEVNRLSVKLDKSDLFFQLRPHISRITNLTEKLIESATLVLITRLNGTIQFGNGAFFMLVNLHPSPSATLESVQIFLKDAPVGKSQLPSGLLNHNGASWSLQKSEMSDEGPNESLFLNTFQTGAGFSMSPDILQEINACLPKLALPASSLAYSEILKSSKSAMSISSQMEKLDMVITEIEEIVRKANIK